MFWIQALLARDDCVAGTHGHRSGLDFFWASHHEDMCQPTLRVAGGIRPLRRCRGSQKSSRFIPLLFSHCAWCCGPVTSSGKLKMIEDKAQNSSDSDAEPLHGWYLRLPPPISAPMRGFRDWMSSRSWLLSSAWFEWMDRPSAPLSCATLPPSYGSGRSVCRCIWLHSMDHAVPRGDSGLLIRIINYYVRLDQHNLINNDLCKYLLLILFINSSYLCCSIPNLCVFNNSNFYEPQNLW